MQLETETENFYEEQYLENPINAFRVFKHLTFDVNVVEEYLQKPPQYSPLKGISIPTRLDLIGASDGIGRLQDFYHINVSDMADGDLRGFKRAPMSVSECIALGHGLYHAKDFKHGVMWMEEAYKRYNESDVYMFDKASIMEVISFGYFKIGKHRSAAAWQREQLNHVKQIGGSLNFDNDNMLATEFEDHEADIEETKELTKNLLYSTCINNKVKSCLPEKKITPYEQSKKQYMRICRGNRGISPVVSKDLKCRYLTGSHPFLHIAPMKVEYMYLKPEITLVHGILTDDEIEHLKHTAKTHKLQRQVINVGGKLFRDRIAKLALLPYNTSSILSRISRKVSALTGLNMDYAVDLQVVNYGIGGYQDVHVDYSSKSKMAESSNEANRNRLATILFYLTDVDSGGATVFQKLGVNVRPVKGAALFWRNLHPSGQGDPATEHGACPVIHGYKWVANAWINQIGNEFSRPCTLKYQKNAIIYHIHRLVRQKPKH